MAKEKKEEVKQEEVKQEIKQEAPVFSKSQLLNAKKYSNSKDLLGAVLDDNFEGTIAEADDLLEKFMKGKVN